MLKFLSENSILGNTLLSYSYVIVGIISAWLFLTVIRFFCIKHLYVLAKKTVNTLDDFVADLFQKVLSPFLYFLILYSAVKTLTLSDSFAKLWNKLFIAVIAIFIAKAFIELFAYLYGLYWKKRGKDLAVQTCLNGILKLATFIIWGFALVFIFDNWGFKVSAVIAGLGIGGIAVALAAQAMLGDIFSYFAILMDSPFEVGDFIIVADYMGVVEHIGIKTTRIRSLGGEQLVLSNMDLTNSRIRNYKRMEKRRIVFSFRVTYNTSSDSLKKIPDLVKEIINSIESAYFDRAHFYKYGDFSLDYEVVYYVLSSDYNIYMDIQQEINLGIKQAFEENNIEFAFPTQTLYLNKDQ
ncbi:MAG: mechanosensitive ion channel family protein [Candidatus Omnitrophica bacterium]|nr:mechanosensitive ion channel family protein [Candidatus Omnitrophota bacterium]MDD5081500.1 mechanosensitive ion channel family protein [Candidatus Omnitrophota bacterium]MDD5441132.1 mechanosensitive ion channel family protein [Candidatus Omnitrophota bacterium]